MNERRVMNVDCVWRMNLRLRPVGVVPHSVRQAAGMKLDGYYVAKTTMDLFGTRSKVNTGGVAIKLDERHVIRYKGYFWWHFC